MIARGRCHMRDRWWSAVCTSVIVTVLTLAGSVARADGPSCNAVDAFQAAKDAWNEAPPASCDPNYSDPVFWSLYAFIGAGAAGVPPGQPNPMQDACAAVKTASDKLTGPVNDLWNLLGSDNQKALQSSPIFSNVSDVSSLAPIMICACDMVFDHGLKELTDDAGVCVLDALCAGFSLFGEIPCDCQNNGASHTTKVIDCTNATLPDPPLQPGQTVQYSSINYDNAVPTGPAYSTTCQNGICTTTQNPATLSGCDATVSLICQCPAPMVIQGIVDSASGANQYYAQCTCPNGTTPGPFAGSKVCMCANGLAMNANGSCPTPKPAPLPQPPKPQPPPACTIAGTVRLADNSCCAPTQATSCGVCCPAGQKPDATGASCISAQPVKYPPPFKQSPLKPTFTPGLPAKP